jgi:excisionase family DNA binding protein
VIATGVRRHDNEIFRSSETAQPQTRRGTPAAMTAQELKILSHDLPWTCGGALPYTSAIQAAVQQSYDSLTKGGLWHPQQKSAWQTQFSMLQPQSDLTQNNRSESHFNSKKAGEIMSPYNPTHASKNAFKDFPDVVSVEELSVMLGHISTKTCYKLLRSGAIQHLRIGRLYRIPKICVINYLASAKTDWDK